MLWDLIRDFFVMHVFGGYASDDTWHIPTIGWNSTDDNPLASTDMHFTIGGLSINLSDWLSTTATAISITIIVVLCCLMIYKIVRLIGGLIR